MADSSEYSDFVSRAWLAAAHAFEISVIAPYVLTRGSKSVRLIAFLPDFGGPNGMVLSLITDTDAERAELQHHANAAGLYITFIDPDVYREFDKKLFWETLKDWSYFGPKTGKPKWPTD